MCVAVKFIYIQSIYYDMIKSNKEENRKEGRELHFIKKIPYNCNEMVEAIGIVAARYLWFEEEATRSFFPRLQTRKVINK